MMGRYSPVVDLRRVFFECSTEETGHVECGNEKMDAKKAIRKVKGDRLLITYKQWAGRYFKAKHKDTPLGIEGDT